MWRYPTSTRVLRLLSVWDYCIMRLLHRTGERFSRLIFTNWKTPSLSSGKSAFGLLFSSAKLACCFKQILLPRHANSILILFDLLDSLLTVTGDIGHFIFLNLTKHNRWIIWSSKITVGRKPQSFNPTWKRYAKYLEFLIYCTAYKMVKHLLLLSKHQQSWLSLQSSSLDASLQRWCSEDLPTDSSAFRLIWTP